MNQKNSDLCAVKSVARTLVYIDPKICDLGFVQHPFIQFSFVPAPDYALSHRILHVDDQQDLIEIRSAILDQIERTTSYLHLLFLIQKPYSGAFFKMSQMYLSDQDFAKALEYIWTNVECPNVDPNVSQSDWIRFFKKAKPELLMDRDEIEMLDQLSDRVVVYRGLQPNASVQGLSWTIDSNVAKWFASRFGHNGSVYRAEIEKCNILAFFGNRGEKEVVVDPKKLIGVETLS